MNRDKILQAIEDTINLLRSEGDVVEVRILNTKQRTVQGYFDEPNTLAQAVMPYVGKHDIYFTLNPVKRELLARSKNRLQSYAKQTTSDKDIERIEFVLVDLDPVRASGISATNEEHKNAMMLAKKIRQFLLDQGFPKPIVCSSGNGYHLILHTNLENNESNVSLLKDFLNALDFLFSNDKVHVDRTTYNPARITKLYGTKATKGDDTEERPHRWSKMKAPEELEPVTREQLKTIADMMPDIKEVKNTKGKSKSDFNIEAWIKDKGLNVAFKTPYNSKGTKYILEICPWNSDHTNHSAYIIKFDGGGIAAGCLHDSCRDKNWASLRDLLEPGWKDEDKGGGNEEKQSDVILRLAEGAQYLTNELEEAHVAVEIDGHTEVMSITSNKFKLYLTKLFYEETKKAPSSDSMNQALKVLEMKAMFSGSQVKLQRRVAEYEGNIYYDLADQKFRAMKVTREGCSIEDKPPILFTRNKKMKEQVVPDLTSSPLELPKLVKQHFRLKKPEDMVLFVVYLISCFVPSISHVILVLHGEKGAAKTTNMRMVKRIVDPSIQDLLSMPTSKQDLAIILSNTYMPCFDNLDAISPEKSDMLCMAATGGAFSKRMLYSDSDETILSFKRCVGLNGINVVATRADLLDRSIVLELDRIPKCDRKTEASVWKAFEGDLPRFLGAIFNTVSKALVLHEEVQLEQVGRMADFTYWGYAIAEVLGLTGESFLNAYLSNQDRANEEAISSHPVAAAVVALMRSHKTWSGSVSALLRELETIAEQEKINTRVKVWPKDAHVLSKRLKEVKSNLEEIDIYFDIRHAGSHKKITVENRQFNGEPVDDEFEPEDDHEFFSDEATKRALANQALSRPQ